MAPRTPVVSGQSERHSTRGFCPCLIRKTIGCVPGFFATLLMGMATVSVRIEYPNRDPENRQLIGESFSIGRDNGDIALHEALVSSSHGELVVDEAQRCVIYTDLGSSNGTYRPTGERLQQPTALAEGHAIYIGGCTITITAITFATPAPMAAPPRGGTFVGEAAGDALQRTPSGTIITGHKAGEQPAVAQPVSIPRLSEQAQPVAYQSAAGSQPVASPAAQPQAEQNVYTSTPAAAPVHHAPAQQPAAHAPAAGVVQPEVPAPSAGVQQPAVQTPQASGQPPVAQQHPASGQPVASVATQPRGRGRWYEADTGTADPHQQTFVMALGSGHIVIRTRTQGQAGPIETMVAAPGALDDFRLL